MDTQKSSASTRRDSTRSITANEANCRQIAAALFVDAEPVMQALCGEPLAVALGMTEWCLTHEADPDFDPARALPAWARKRQRGYWRPTREVEIEAALAALDGDGSRDDELARYWSTNRSFIIGEMDRMAGSLGQCFDCQARRRSRDMLEVQPEQADNSLEFGGGELLCVDCAGKHGLR